MPRAAGVPRGPATAFILVTAMLDVMAMGLVIPVLPILVEQFAGRADTAGLWNGLLVALWAVMQFVCSPLIGSLSDRYGRRPVILISVAGQTADWTLMALAPDLVWLAIGRMIGGATSASFTAVYAYMADITPPEDRSRAYGLIGAAFSLGFVGGPALGGVLGVFGPRTPFWVAAALSALAFLYGLVVLPESLPPERRMPFAWRRANPLGAFRLLTRHRELGGLSIVNFLLYFAHHVFSAVYVLYAAMRHDLTTFQTGLLLAAAGGLDMIVQGLLVARVSRRLGDRMTMTIGLVCGALGLALMGLADTPLLFALTLVPCALWGLAMPTILALMTRHVSEREQGQLQGASNSVGSVAGIVSPLFFGWLYGVSALAWPGLSFMVAAGVLLAAALLGMVLTAREARLT